MDRSKFSKPEPPPLTKHTGAIRRNKDILAHVFAFLSENPPNASAAQESFAEISDGDQIALFIAPSKGGIWETWERDAIKFGDLDVTNSYAVWQRRPALGSIES